MDVRLSFLDFHIGRVRYEMKQQWPKLIRSALRASTSVAYDAANAKWRGVVRVSFSGDDAERQEEPILSVDAFLNCTFDAPEGDVFRTAFIQLLQTDAAVALLGMMRSQIATLSMLLGCPRPIVLQRADPTQWKWNNQESKLN